MIWYAPIWLNEMLVSITSFIVGFMFFVLPISFIFILASFIKFLIKRGGHRRSLMDFIKIPSTLIVLISLVMSCAILAFFYIPQKVIPNGCKFSEISMVTDIIGVVSDREIISDNEKLNELRNIFRAFYCRRSLDNGPITQTDSNKVDVDMVIYSKNKSSSIPFHCR